HRHRRALRRARGHRRRRLARLARVPRRPAREAGIGQPRLSRRVGAGRTPSRAAGLSARRIRARPRHLVGYHCVAADLRCPEASHMVKGILFAALAAMKLVNIASNFDGRAGLAAIDLDTGQRINFRETDQFPMASVYKVPVAIALLQRVDRGEVSLDTSVTLGPDDFHAGASIIADKANGQPVTLTLSQLFTHMVRDSDNSAIDYVFAHYVAPKEVMSVLRAIGAKNIDVSRPEAMIIGEILNEGDVIETRARYAKRIKTLSPPE